VPLKVVRGRPRLTLVAVCGGRDAPHIGVARLLVVAIIVVGHGCGPLKALLAPLFAALDALPATMDGDIRRRFLAAAWGHLPTCPSLVKHDCLIAGAVFGGDVARCLECVPTKVAMLAREWAPCGALRLHARAPRVSLAAGMWLDAPALLPQRVP
jgi:hypothetical protein